MKETVFTLLKKIYYCPQTLKHFEMYWAWNHSKYLNLNLIFFRILNCLNCLKFEMFEDSKYSIRLNKPWGRSEFMTYRNCLFVIA